ncbi:Hypothetical small peptide [Latilactobacillus sakei subsp. sakei 23K]|uniref:Hypothetical small peptide n=1 Tax=Latilactobacillus sakei subsp. sakei (strain 23K) TaxID=314315 RepID=Q38ZK3_LATSS|nr:Hypothetical small peptide [Latilactobacillus sakei subsp. sakei 23K]
MGLGGVVR